MHIIQKTEIITQSRLVNLPHFLFVPVLSQPFLALVRGYLMSFSFFTARHNYGL
jgi:hypothetical protein